MKARIAAVLSLVVLSAALAVAPASAYTSAWRSDSSTWVQLSCGGINHGHTSDRAFINSNGCGYYVGIRAKWNEAGADRITAWSFGDTLASVSRSRIFAYQYQY